MKRNRAENQPADQDLWNTHSEIVQTYIQQHDLAKALAERGRPDLITPAFDRLDPLERDLMIATAHVSRAHALWYQRQRFPDDPNIRRRLGNESASSYERGRKVLDNGLNVKDVGTEGDGGGKMDDLMYIEQLPNVLQVVLTLMNQGAVEALDRYLEFIPGMPSDDRMTAQLECRNNRRLTLNGLRQGTDTVSSSMVGKKPSSQRELVSTLQERLDKSFIRVTPLNEAPSP